MTAVPHLQEDVILPLDSAFCHLFTFQGELGAVFFEESSVLAQEGGMLLKFDFIGTVILAFEMDHDSQV